MRPPWGELLAASLELFGYFWLQNMHLGIMFAASPSSQPPCCFREAKAANILAASLQLFGQFLFPEMHLGVVSAAFVQFLSNFCFRACLVFEVDALQAVGPKDGGLPWGLGAPQGRAPLHHG